MAKKKNGEYSKRSTKQIYEERVEQILPLISLYTRREILKIIRKNFPDWKVSDVQIDLYINKAREILKEETAVYRQNCVENAQQNFNLALRKFKSIDDWHGFLKAQIEMNKLFGLYDKKDDDSEKEKDDVVIVDDI